ncbi:hypothetical protein RSOLAG22IIIB_00025 [Rhizoctonia solani]|uniref:Uncharacterized protein n=1 Tax=Rhizoctonia solani TaxID=456999 RepID=A0A0K6FK05_9AGAM|nr:hypothetical protein RSOLAG22IIIB_00025 [Rhizoctonia solani]
MNCLPAGDRWAVGLAPRALREVQKFKRSKKSLDMIWEKIRELSYGRYTVVPDKTKEFDHQAVKILRINTRAHIDYDLWRRVSSYLFREQDSEYRSRCMLPRPGISSASEEYLPYKFPHNPRASSSIHPEDAEEGGVDEVIIALGSGRYVAATKSLYDSIVEYSGTIDTTEETNTIIPPKVFHPLGRIRLPPDPDPRQYEIINHRGVSIVVGRSGTGKTTALIYKMHAIDQSATTSVRLMFVTRSRVLARHVESSFGRLADSVNMESEGAEELGTDLPHRFSLLNEPHFPLFISFDKLCSLIEAGLYEEQKAGKREFWVTQQRRIIGFKEFKEVYWPRFKLGCQWASTLNPTLVYSEVVGVIQGYSEALGCINGHLSLDEYLGRAAHKVSPHLDDSAKHQIYSIFKEYKKIKSLRSEWDHADRSHYILEKFKENISYGTLGEAYEIGYLSAYMQLITLIMKPRAPPPPGLFGRVGNDGSDGSK